MSPTPEMSPATARKPMHRRDIVLQGYAREDGLFDIEAELTDTKSYGFTLGDRGWLEPGAPVHLMRLRLVVDASLTIQDCEAEMAATPYGICPQVAPNFAQLAGLQIGRGFLKTMQARLGGVQGCTHLRELLQQMATIAFQTIAPLRRAQEAAPDADPDAGGRALLNTCHGFAADGPVVARRWPSLATKNDGPSLATPSGGQPAGQPMAHAPAEQAGNRGGGQQQ